MDVNQIIQGDALSVLKGLPDGIVQTCCTSPPYYGLRDYQTETILQLEGDPQDCQHVWIHEGRNEDGAKVAECQHCFAAKVDQQIGLEETPEAYVAKLVEVFREVRRVLRDDGVLWLNLGDSYAGNGKSQPQRDMSGGFSGRDQGTRGQQGYSNASGSGYRHVSTDFFNCFEGFIKGQPLIFGNATAIRITSKRRDVPLHDNGFPYGILLSLLGIERITIKQRDNNFCQVFNILNNESYCWISCPVISYMMTNSTDIEIVFDAVDSISIVISDLNTDIHSVLRVSGITRTGAGKQCDSSLSIEEAHKPMPKCLRDIEPIGNTVTFDTPLKRFPDIYLVDDAVTLRDGFDSSPSYSGNFRITQASREQFCFNLEKCGVEIGTTCITHMFAPNQFGSLVRYSELYDKAQRKSNTLRPKQELGIPFMVRQALMEEGWICRSTIIWNKPNCMPESVEDRPTKSHEYLFLLSKNERYYYDADGVREPHTLTERLNGRTPNFAPHQWIPNGNSFGNHNRAGGDGVGYNPAGRNKRTVWTVASQPYSEAHFATFPPKLIEPCILAGTSPRACEHCGSPWERMTARVPMVVRNGPKSGGYGSRTTDSLSGTMIEPAQSVTTGWQPTCTCSNEGTGKCIILDPFIGAGTTALVAIQHGRNYLGIDLNVSYVQLAEKRIATVQQNLWTSGSEAMAV